MVYYHARFEALTAVHMKLPVFWDMRCVGSEGIAGSIFRVVQEEWALVRLPRRLESYIIYYVVHNSGSYPESLESNLAPHYVSQMNINVMFHIYV
jgi:hypothetical protein